MLNLLLLLGLGVGIGGRAGDGGATSPAARSVLWLGAAAVGYHRAGFDVVGVDHVVQKHYPFAFIQADALEFLAAGGAAGFDAIHASPPCQGYSRMRHLPWLKGREWPMLIEPCRELLQASGLIWVIENVADAPLGGIILCGQTFGLKVYRHRRFESSLLLLAPPHEKHRETIGNGREFNSRARANTNGWCSTVGRGRGTSNVGAAAMGIDWMTRSELSQAIPPSFTEFVGRQLLAALAAERGAA